MKKFTLSFIRNEVFNTPNERNTDLKAKSVESAIKKALLILIADLPTISLIEVDRKHLDEIVIAIKWITKDGKKMEEEFYLTERKKWLQNNSKH